MKAVRYISGINRENNAKSCVSGSPPVTALADDAFVWRTKMLD
jgi:hypothetical protein